MINKISLKLLKDLVIALEDNLTQSEKLKEESGPDSKYVIEMARALGICTGISAEASALVGDIAVTVRNSASVPEPKNSLFEDLLKKYDPVKN